MRVEFPSELRNFLGKCKKLELEKKFETMINTNSQFFIVTFSKVLLIAVIAKFIFIRAQNNYSGSVSHDSCSGAQASKNNGILNM